MKTIEDAVIRFNGVWQECFDIGFAPLGLTREQFEAESKRLGYINGYKYMNEYTEKGKPNLPDDVMVSVMTYCRGRLPARHVGFWNWYSSEIKSFRIVDERYKPADTRYLKKVSEDERFGIMPPININERCDLNNWHERGELPPVGTKCLCWFDDGRECWHECFVIGSIDSEIKNGYLAVSLVGEHERKLVWANEFRPIKSHREKVIEAAVMAVESNNSTSESIYDTLYDAGMLVLPQDSGDTKD